MLMYGLLTVTRTVEQNTIIMIREGELRIALENPKNNDAIAGIFDTVGEMLDWSAAQQGDIAVVNLLAGSEVYMLIGANPSVLNNWKKLTTTS